MDQNFALLFRSSRLVSLDSKQVIKTTKHLWKQGDWGLKRNLPKCYSHKFVTAIQDDTFKRTFYQPATELVGSVHRWRENFPIPKESFPLPKTIPLEELRQKLSRTNPDFAAKLPIYTESPRYVNELNEQEYKQLLISAKQLNPLWKELRKTHLIASTDWNHLLNVLVQPIASFEPKGDGQSFVHPPTYRSQQLLKSMNVELPKVGQMVKGRVLNALERGFAIGIGGYIAFYPSSHIEQRSFNRSFKDSVLLDFYVTEARFDALGRPEIIVSRKQLQPNSTAFFNKEQTLAPIVERHNLDLILSKIPGKFKK